MRPTRRHLTLSAAALTTALTLSACGSDTTGSGSMGDMTHGSTSSTSATSSTSSTSDARAADVMFAQMMIPHHEQAVEMADLALQSSAATDEVKALARQIKAAQDPEIQTMKGWLSEWGAAAAPGMGHDMGDGMMSAADMTALGKATGAAFDRMWLTMMIEHHEGAVDMAEKVLATTADDRVKQLAQAVVDGQTKEIATMKGMLG